MGEFLRNLPVAAGIAGGSLLVLNRLLGTGGLDPGQVRSDALGLALAGVLILVGLLQQQVVPVPPEEVTLTGEAQDMVAGPLRARPILELIGELLVGQSGTRTLLVWWQGEVVLCRGIFPVAGAFMAGDIVKRAIRTQKPVYLVDLRLFPGRVEFSYLPDNLRAIVCQPLGEQGVLLVGAGAARSFSAQELAWIETLAHKLSALLAEPNQT